MKLNPVTSALNDTAWMDKANCLGTDPEAWHPGKGGRVSGLQRKVCALCDVRGECLAYALANKLPGIWGGMTDLERRALRREMNV